MTSGPSDSFSIAIEDFQASLLTADDFDFIAWLTGALLLGPRGFDVSGSAAR